MKPSKKQLRYLLAIWGDWRRKGCRGLGYPSQTAESRLLTSPGRATGVPGSPNYEPDPVAKRVDDAMEQIEARQRNLLYCRYVMQMSDLLLMEYDHSYKTEGQARWAVEKAMKRIGSIL